MNYVVAKIDNKKKESCFKNLLSVEKLYDIPSELDDALEYQEGVILEANEWFKVENFSSYSYYPEYLKERFRTSDFELIKLSEVGEIEFVFSVEDGVYCFQRIFKQNLLKQKYITLGDNIALKKNQTCLIINKIPDAIYKKETDILYFKKLQTVAPIFEGIYSLYREATNEETEQFLREDFIQSVNEYDVNKVGTMNRKRIAMAMETLAKYGKKQRKQLLDYTHYYYPSLRYENNKFLVGNETDMKYLLWGIEQRYYTTPIDNEKRVANSIVVLSS